MQTIDNVAQSNYGNVTHHEFAAFSLGRGNNFDQYCPANNFLYTLQIVYKLNQEYMWLNLDHSYSTKTYLLMNMSYCDREQYQAHDNVKSYFFKQQIDFIPYLKFI